MTDTAPPDVRRKHRRASDTLDRIDALLDRLAMVALPPEPKEHDE